MYDELTNRNKWLIPDIIKHKVASSRILFLGCGLGSVIAGLAARTGFKNFVLVDGDVVEISNLNRQDFSYSDVGSLKTKIVEGNILSINPAANVERVDSYIIKLEQLKQHIEQSDFIINMLDADDIVYDVNSYAQSLSKTVLFPMNIGFGSMVFVFNNHTCTLENLTRGKRVRSNKLFLQLALKYFPYKDFYDKKIAVFLLKSFAKENKMYFPQLGIATWLTASIVITTILRILDGRNVPTAPNVISADVLKFIKD